MASGGPSDPASKAAGFDETGAVSLRPEPKGWPSRRNTREGIPMPVDDRETYLKAALVHRIERLQAMLRAVNLIDVVALDAIAGKVPMDVAVKHIQLYTRTTLTADGKKYKAYREHRKAQRAEARAFNHREFR